MPRDRIYTFDGAGKEKVDGRAEGGRNGVWNRFWLDLAFLAILFAFLGEYRFCQY